MNNILRLPALEVVQGPHRIYSFAADGKRLAEFVTVRRLERGADGALIGFARGKLRQYVSQISRFIESQNALFLNAIVIAFDESVTFVPHEAVGNDWSRPGELAIPLPGCNGRYPGVIVDGHQRYAALGEAEVTAFPVCVTGFIGASLPEMITQFLLLNNIKPLPTASVYEMLPETGGCLPSGLSRRSFPSHLMNRLNWDADSPFRGMIDTPTAAEGVINANAVLRMLDRSLSEGPLRLCLDQEDQILMVIKSFWMAVASVFCEAWELPVRRSLLRRGVGIMAMGALMDEIVERCRDGKSIVVRQEVFEGHLEGLKDVTAWTGGTWRLEPHRIRQWNALRATTEDVVALSDYLAEVIRTRF